jgi:murein L,D-transpeptidase YcbB/YkuD
MMGKALDERPKSKAPEIAIPMPATVPVYLTYLTVTRSKDGVAILPDVYGLDQAKK